MKFVKYQHIERFGTIETSGIDIGEVYVFPKIDGTNGSVWLKDGELQFGSRNHHLDDHDNTGFKESLFGNINMLTLLQEYPDWILYGEWLVPHTLKTYRDEAWRKFYIFDVFDGERYLHYDEYAPFLDALRIEHIPPVRIIENPTEERLISFLDVNTYLIKDGCGTGEGIVIKNYAYRNRFGRQTWAKIVRNEFKQENQKAFGLRPIQEKAMVEEKIVTDFQTAAMAQKVYANIVSENDGWSSKFIPRLLNTVFYDLVREECWNFVKKLKNPLIDFGRLQKLSYAKTKRDMAEIFN